MRSTIVGIIGLWAAACVGTPVTSAPGDGGAGPETARADSGPANDAGAEDGAFDDGDEDGIYDGGDEPYDTSADPPEEDAGTALSDAGAAPPEVTAVEATYRLLQWNIAGGKENDCRADLIAHAVRRFVEDHAVDFVSLNEVCPGQHDAIRAQLRAAWGLGDNDAFSAYQGDGTPRIVGDSIFARFGLAAVTRVQLGRDQYGTRNLLCGRVTGERHLRVCTTHLSVGDNTASAQMATVLDRLEAWWTANGDTVLLAGDLNLAANHAGLNPVYAASANTPNNGGNTGRYRELDDADPANCPGYGERSTPGTGGGPCGTGGKIDFIFVRQNRIVAGDYAGDTLNIPDDCTGACSDHRPLVGHAKVRVRRD